MKINKIIVLLNTSNPLQLDFLKDNEYGIDAVLWVGGVGPSTSGLPRRHGQTPKARDFCYSKPEGNVENNTFSLSLKKKKKEEKRKKCSACELSAAVRATYDFLLFSEHSCLIL